MKTGRSFAAAAAVLLSACASMPAAGPGMTNAGLQTPAHWQGQALGAVPANAAPSRNWLADFDDARLNALVAEALAHNHDVLASYERIAQARALAVSAGAARLPTLDVSGLGSDTLVQKASDTTSYGAKASVSWEADLWGRLAERARAGKVDQKAAEADYAAARLSIAGQTALAWFDLTEAAQQIVLAKDDLQTRQRSLRLVERRYARGVSTSLDVRLARSAQAVSEATLALREQQSANAGRRLELLLGRYPANAIAAAARLPQLGPLNGIGTPEDILVRRPDLLAAEARLEAAHLRALEARKALLPRLSFTASSSTGGGAVSDVFDLDTLFGALVGNLTQPVFRGGALKAEVRRARAVQRERLQSYANLVLRAWRETEDALDGERYLARREAALNAATREAREAERLALHQYGRGVGTIFELLDAQRRRISAESQFIAARKEHVANRVRLHLAIAGDFNSKPQAVKTAALADEDKPHDTP